VTVNRVLAVFLGLGLMRSAQAGLSASAAAGVHAVHSSTKPLDRAVGEQIAPATPRQA
jgi:hypothetical protein